MHNATELQESTKVFLSLVDEWTDLRTNHRAMLYAETVNLTGPINHGEIILERIACESELRRKCRDAALVVLGHLIEAGRDGTALLKFINLAADDGDVEAAADMRVDVKAHLQAVLIAFIKPVEQDGVYSDHLCIDGKRYDITLTGINRKLVTYMFNRTDAPKREVLKACWPVQVATDGTIRNQLFKLKKLTVAADLPWRIECFDGYFRKQHH